MMLIMSEMRIKTELINLLQVHEITIRPVGEFFMWVQKV